MLYDYHLAQGLIDQLPNDEREKMAQEYINAVYQKHGITEAQFDSSVIYYNRHTKELAKIYDNLKERLTEETEAIKLANGSNDMTAIFAEGGDTSNIWNSTKMFVLRNKENFCTESYTIIADTSFHKHDQFILNFSPIIITENKNYRDGVLHIGLSLVYKNGKTIGTTRQVTYNDAQQMTIKAIDDQEISKVSGFFFYKGSDDIRNYCVVNNISLVRMHERQDEVEAEKTDSVKTDSIKKDTTAVSVPERRLTPEEVRLENQSGNKINIQSAPAVRTPNSYGPRRRNNTSTRGQRQQR